jgi:cation transport ATPase
MSIAVYIVSFGLLAVLVIGAIWYFIGSLITAADKLQETSVSTMLPGSQGDLNSARQIPQIKQFREQLNKQNRYANGQMPTDEEIIVQQNSKGHDTEDTVMQAQEMIQKTRKAQTEAMIGKAPDDEKAQYAQMARELAGKASLFMIPIALAFLWGIFYFPAACAVAGYTGSFSATLNPFVGLDTIRRLGFSYVKILLMCLLILILFGAASVVLAMIFSSFDLPRMGNIPAKIVGSFVAFYFSIVFSCILGFALYKNSDRLRLLRA